MSLLAQLKQLQTLDQQHQELTAKLRELERQQEELAKSILKTDCPFEAHVQINPSTIAWIDHPDNWDDNDLRSAITFHELTPIDA